MRPSLILVRVTMGPTGAFHADSQDLKGLHVLENTRDALRDEVPRVIADLFESRQQKVVVQSVDCPSDEILIYVAVPTAEALDLCA